MRLKSLSFGRESIVDIGKRLFDVNRGKEEKKINVNRESVFKSKGEYRNGNIIETDSGFFFFSFFSIPFAMHRNVCILLERKQNQFGQSI